MNGFAEIVYKARVVSSGSEARIDGSQIEITVVKGSPLPPEISSCIRSALAPGASFQPSQLSAVIADQIRRTYGSDAKPGFPDRFEGTAGGTLEFVSGAKD